MRERERLSDACRSTCSPNAPGPRSQGGAGRRLLSLVLALILVASAAAGCLSVGSASKTDAATSEDTEEATDRESRPSGNASEASEPSSNGTVDEQAIADEEPKKLSAWGCKEIFTLHEVPKAWAAQHTPEGFEPQTFFPPNYFGVPTNQTAKAAFIVNTAHCDEISTSDGEVFEGTHEITYGVFVDPPEEYQSEHVKGYISPFTTMVGDPERAATLGEADLPVEEGQIDLSTRTDDSLRVWTVTGESSTVDSFRFDIAATGEHPAVEEVEVFRFFGTETDGSVSHALDLAAQPNATQSPLIPMGGLGSASSYELLASDAPSPAPTPNLITNLKFTPADKVAFHLTVVDFSEDDS